MKKKILIAVDDSLQSKSAIKYAARASQWIEDLTHVLLHVQPAISQYLLDEAKKNYQTRIEMDNLIARHTKASKQLLDKCKAQMIDGGIDPQRVSTVTKPRKLGLAKDIIEFAQAGQYDALVMGRRGSSALQSLFTGSVSSQVVDHSQLIPCWLIAGDPVAQKILVPVDGSEFSLRAIDHLAFMLRGNTEVQLTFLHVRPKLQSYCEIDFEQNDAAQLNEVVVRGDQKCIDNFYVHALRTLNTSGIQETQIDIRTVAGFRNPSAAIVKEIRNEHFDTVVMGRSGMNKSFFTGSITRQVLNAVGEAAVWIVP